MTQHLLTASIIGQAIAILCSFLYTKLDRDILARCSKWLLTLSWVFVTFVIILKWMGDGRPPFKTLHESLILLAWCIHFIGFLTYFTNKYPLLWLLVGIGTTASLIYALVNTELERVFLPPALQSIWFVPHVVVYFVGYSALILGTIGLLWGSCFEKTLRKIRGVFSTQGQTTHFLHQKIVRAGYLFLTTGLILGAIWADEAWGTYWGWDPKESWALATFLFYGGFLHLNEARQESSTGKFFLLLGVGSILFTYLGMHLLPTAEVSVHVYQ